MHLINAENRHLYGRELEDLFRARKQIFVDGFGWDLPLTPEGLEIDRYDDDRTQYVVGFDTQDNVVMSLRLRPADDGSILGDIFGHSVDPAVRPLTDGKTWEATRGFCLEFGRKPWNMQRKGACMAAPFEILQAQGADRLVAFTDVRMFNWVVNMGWPMTVLGDSVHYGEGAGFALEVEITDQVIRDMRARWDLPERSYIHIDSLEPGETVHTAAIRTALESGFTHLLPREDLSKLRRSIREGESLTAGHPVPQPGQSTGIGAIAAA